MLNLYTACIYQFRESENVLDITRMTGKRGLIFAPSWDLLSPYLAKRKNGSLSPEDWSAYRRGFIAEMKASAEREPELWAQWKAFIDSKEEITFTFCCYCASPEQCHRSILVEIFKKRGAVYLGERQARLF